MINPIINLLFRPKHIILIIFLLVWCFNVHAQVGFLDPDTAVWRLRGFVVTNPICLFHDWQFMLSSQDTVVNSHTYRNVFQLGHGKVYFACIEPPLGSTTPLPTVPLLGGLIREEGRKVYFWRTYWPEEYLAYDFDQEAGDTVLIYQYYFPYNVIIDTVEEIELQGRIFKQYVLKQGNDNQIVDKFIEGIGSIHSSFSTDFGGLQLMELVCYSRNDTILYQKYDSCAFYELPGSTTSINEDLPFKVDELSVVKLIYPNPSATFANLIFRNISNYSVEVFDLKGRLIKEHSIINSDEIKIDISLFYQGVYILQIKENGMLVSIEKLIVL